eukprot:Lankesteria_metandrocarpae@DN2698_c0_g1_i1.p1
MRKDAHLVQIFILAGKNLLPKEQSPSLYVAFNWSGESAKTRVMVNTHNPYWSEGFRLQLEEKSAKVIRLEVWRSYLLWPHTKVGHINLSVESITIDKQEQRWCDVAGGHLLLELKRTKSAPAPARLPSGLNTTIYRVNTTEDNEISEAALWLIKTTIFSEDKTKTGAPKANMDKAKKTGKRDELVNKLNGMFPTMAGDKLNHALMVADLDETKAIDILLEEQITDVLTSSPQAKENKNAALHVTMKLQSAPSPVSSPPLSPPKGNMLGVVANPLAPPPFPGAGALSGKTFMMFAQAAPLGGPPPFRPNTPTSVINADSVAFAKTLVPPSGRSKALLIGINYTGTKRQLTGCVPDVERMKKMVTSLYGFSDHPAVMTCLRDNSKDPQFQPTKKNILCAIDWLAEDAQKGDVLFFHFSGHGSQIKDVQGTEVGGFDQTILPVDYKTGGAITDDELHQRLVAQLPNGCKLTAIMDCCHSGTGLDLPYKLDLDGNRWEVEPNPKYGVADIQMFSGCADDETSADVQIASYGSGGAMSLSLLAVLSAQPYTLSIFELMQKVRTTMRARGFKQQPQLSTTAQFSTKRHFSLNEIYENSNELVGRRAAPPTTGRNRRAQES